MGNLKSKAENKYYFKNKHKNKQNFNFGNASNEQEAENLKEVQNVLRKGLAELYENLVLPQVSFMRERREKSIYKEYYMQLQVQMGDEKTDIKLHDLFNETTKQSSSSRAAKPTRILVESQPGFGKTTLCSKIAYDWAKGERYLQQFTLVFFLKLRDLLGKRVDEKIQIIAERYGIEDEQIVLKLLRQRASTILFLLDGFDELSREDRESCIRVIYKQIHCDVTVLLTCRTGLFDVDWEEIEKIFFGIDRTRVFHDIKVQIIGVDETEMKRFVRLCNPNERGQEVVDFLDQMNTSLKTMFKSPLIISILVFLVTKNEINLTDLPSNVNFILVLVNRIVCYCVSRKNGSVSKTFNIFDLNDDSSTEYKDVFHNFGREAMVNVEAKIFSLQDLPLTKRIYEMGLLVKHENEDTGFVEYEPFHLTFLELAVAYYIWRECLKSDLQLNSFCYFLFEQFEESNGMSPILYFLGDLLQDKISILFSVLLEYPDLRFSQRNLVRKINFSTVGVNSSKNLIPLWISTFLVRFKHRENKLEITDPSVKKEEIILSHLNDFCQLPNHVLLHRLLFSKRFTDSLLTHDNNESEEEVDFRKQLEKVCCHFLCMEFLKREDINPVLLHDSASLESVRKDSNFTKTFLSVFSSIPATKRFLKLSNQVEFNEFPFEELKKVTIDALYLEKWWWNHDFKTLSKIISTHALKKLKLFIYDTQILHQLFSEAQSLRTLEDIEIDAGKQTKQLISIHHLRNINPKWKNVCLPKISFINDSSETDITINRLQFCFNHRKSIHVLNSIHLRVLQCQDFEFLDIVRCIGDSWSGFRTIKQLSVFCNESLCLQLCNGLNYFVGLKTVKFTLPEDNVILYDEKCSIFNIDSSRLNIYVMMNYFNDIYVNLPEENLNNFVLKPAQIFSDRNSNRNRVKSVAVFKTLNVQFEGLMSYDEEKITNFLKILLDLVKKQLVFNLGVIFRDLKWWYLFKSKFNDYASIYDFKDDYLGSAEDDPIEYRDDMNAFEPRWNRISIFLK